VAVSNLSARLLLISVLTLTLIAVGLDAWREVFRREIECVQYILHLILFK
jgi:hypothetical protein